MAKKKRPSPTRRAPAPDVAAPATGNAARRARKDQKRREEEEAQRRRVRRASMRRAIAIMVAGAMGFAAIWFIQRAPSPQPLSAEAAAAAAAAGCSAVRTPVTGEPVRTHLPEGQSTVYPERPATSGAHSDTPLPADPRVLDAPVDETQAVHSLEHAAVILDYRADGANALPADVVDALVGVTGASGATYLIPYPDLPAGTALALTAWNKVMTCPGAITAAQATTIAQGFVDAYECTSNAPEARAQGNGC